MYSAGSFGDPSGGVTPDLLPEVLADHLDRLYRAAWALCGSREDAEDLVQETYARVLSRSRLLRERDDLGYLLRTLRNTFLARCASAAAGRSRRPSHWRTSNSSTRAKTCAPSK